MNNTFEVSSLSSIYAEWRSGISLGLYPRDDQFESDLRNMNINKKIQLSRYRKHLSNDETVPRTTINMFFGKTYLVEDSFAEKVIKVHTKLATLQFLDKLVNESIDLEDLKL